MHDLCAGDLCLRRLCPSFRIYSVHFPGSLPPFSLIISATRITLQLKLGGWRPPPPPGGWRLMSLWLRQWERQKSTRLDYQNNNFVSAQLNVFLFLPSCTARPRCKFSNFTFYRHREHTTTNFRSIRVRLHSINQSFILTRYFEELKTRSKYEHV